MKTIPDSVRRQPVPPLRHPYYQSARDEQAEKARAERQALILRDDAFRIRLAASRILEAVA